MLLAAHDLGLEAVVGEMQLEPEADPADEVAALVVQLLQPLGDRGIGVGLELLEGQRLHLVHELVHADPLGERRVDIHRLAGDPAALLLVLDVVERAHVVQPVGELDQQHADVVRHGEQELAQILGGALVLRLRLDLGELGDAVDQPRDVLAEQLLDLFGGRQRVLDRVVEDRGDDRLVVELEVGEDAGDFDRVAEIGVARGARLGAVRLHREDIGAVDQRLVGVGIVGPDLLDQFILAQHRTKMGRGGAECASAKGQPPRGGIYSFATMFAAYLCFASRSDEEGIWSAHGTGRRRTSMRSAKPALHCPLPRAVELIGEKWAFLILRGAFNGLHHFEEFQAGLGIARNILSDRLGKLVAGGILERTPDPSDKRKVDLCADRQGRGAAAGGAGAPPMGRGLGPGRQRHRPRRPRNRRPIRRICVQAEDGRELQLERTDVGQRRPAPRSKRRRPLQRRPEPPSRVQLARVIRSRRRTGSGAAERRRSGAAPRRLRSATPALRSRPPRRSEPSAGW